MIRKLHFATSLVATYTRAVIGIHEDGELRINNNNNEAHPLLIDEEIWLWDD